MSRQEPLPQVPWNARTVEHLLNRAGFGATRAEIDAALGRGPQAVVGWMVSADPGWKPAEKELLSFEEYGYDRIGQPVAGFERGERTTKEIGRMRRDMRGRDRVQFLRDVDRLFRSMIAGRAPLRDRMVLFWHGFFTTCSRTVRRKYEVLNQLDLVVQNALGSYAELLRAMVRDPAMLVFLDNNTNVKGHPNENLARELLELYSLGEGNYTEVDVREAARALTGCSCTDDGAYLFRAELHDDGEKTVLGRTGRLGPDELVDAILAHPACARWVAGRLIAFLEGAAPAEARLARYAALLRESDYRMQPLLEALLLDPEFYREAVIGARVQGPIEFVVGICRRARIDPPDPFLYCAAAALGEVFYEPPTVKGWEGGESWLSHSTLLLRGNCAGLLLGTFDEQYAEAERMDPAAEPASDLPPEVLENVALLLREARSEWHLAGWEPDLDLAGRARRAGASSDAELVEWALDELHASAPTDELRALLAAYLAAQRAAFGVAPGAPLLDAGEPAELALRRLARLLYSTPEAQLG